VLSDIHCEFHADGGRAFIASLAAANTDVLVVAGDLCTSDRMDDVLPRLTARFPTVVYVTGNHKCYGSHPDAVHACLAGLAARLSNLHWLDNSTCDINGVRFAGGTLWFPERPDNVAYRGFLSDFRLIEDFEPWVYEQHKLTRALLVRETQRADVVVTHHLPTHRCVAPRYASSPLNRFFVADVDEFVEVRGGPRLWVHGHTHESVDIEVAGTRVVCNPLGYPREVNDAFVDEFVVELPPR